MIRPFYNWQIKLLSVLAAVILWFFVVGIDNNIFVFPEPLEIQISNLGSNVSLATALPKVRVYLRMDKDLQGSLSKNDLTATIDLQDLNIGEHKLSVLISSKNNVTVLKTEPAEVNIKLAALAEKQVQVIANFSGSPQNGFMIKELAPAEKKVKISGARNILDKIDKVIATVVLDGSQNTTFSQNVVLTIPDLSNLVKGSVKIEPEQIDVTANIVSTSQQKSLTIVPNIIGSADSKLLADRLIIQPTTIIVEGDETTLKNLNTVTTVPIDVKTILQATQPLNVDLTIPANVTSITTKASLALNLSGKDLKTLEAPVVLTRQNSNFKIQKVTPETIKVTVYGDFTQLKNLKKGDITLNLNLTTVSSPGPVNINSKDIIVPNGVDLFYFEPKQLQLEI